MNVDKGEFGRGIIPDYPIQPTYEDYKNGNDVVLEKAKSLIENNALPNNL